MTSTLSYSAIRQIIDLVVYGPVDWKADKNAFAPHQRMLPLYMRKYVNNAWRAVFELYVDLEPARPPLAYLNSLELPLVLKGQADDEDVRALFAHAMPLEFWGCPRLLVSKIVEVRRRRFKR